MGVAGHPRVATKDVVDGSRTRIRPPFPAVRRVRNKAGTVTDIWIAGGHLIQEKAMAAEIERRYAPRKRRAAR